MRGSFCRFGRIAAEGLGIVERVDVFADDLHRRALDLEQPRVLRLLVGLHVRIGERVLHDEIEELLVRRDRHRLDAAVDRALGQDRRQRALRRRSGRRRIRLRCPCGTCRTIMRPSARECAIEGPFSSPIQNVPSASRTMPSASKPLRSRGSGLPRAVHGVLGGRGLERIEHARERIAVAVLERDHVGDAEGAVVEQHHAVDRGRVGRRRIDAAVLHALAGREARCRRSLSSRCRRCWDRGRRPSRSRSADRSGRARRRSRCRR